MKLMLDLFERQLQNLYNSEMLILKSLPEMQEYGTDEKLKENIESYTEETRRQVVRLQDIGTYLKIEMTANDGKIIRGLLEDVRELYQEFPKGLLMDAGLISKLQHIEHFQISAYETAILYTANLGIGEVTKKLEKTLNEAYEADEADEHCSQYANNLLHPNKTADHSNHSFITAYPILLTKLSANSIVDNRCVL